MLKVVLAYYNSTPLYCTYQDFICSGFYYESSGDLSERSGERGVERRTPVLLPAIRGSLLRISNVPNFAPACFGFRDMTSRPTPHLPPARDQALLGWAAIRGDGGGRGESRVSRRQGSPPSRGSDDPTQAYTTPTRRRARSLNANNAVTTKHIYRALRPTKFTVALLADRPGRGPCCRRIFPSSTRGSFCHAR